MAAASALPRILAIHAHPDDIEILCAGTLARLKDRGCEIVMASMTPGDKGSAELGADEIAAVRRKEAQAAADLLGAEYMCLEFRDLSIDVVDASRRKVTEALRKARADVVLTAPPVDYMSDHESTSRLVRDACFCASVHNYRTEQWDPAPRLPRIPALYFMDPIDGIDWFGKPIPPDFVIDISDKIQLKLDMLAYHASQRAWLQQQHGMDEYLDAAKRFSHERGESIGVKYGEGFRQYLGHPYPQDNVLLKVLGETP